MASLDGRFTVGLDFAVNRRRVLHAEAYPVQVARARGSRDGFQIRH